MDVMPLTAERKVQLEDYARRHGKAAAEALDEVLAEYFAWESEDRFATEQAIRRGYDDVKAGRLKSAEDVHRSIRQKYGFPG